MMGALQSCTSIVYTRNRKSNTKYKALLSVQPWQLCYLRLKKGDAYYTYRVYISSVSMERKVEGKDLEMSC